jgi:glycosyltransferase involved in cell wall biosynthesis
LHYEGRKVIVHGFPIGIEPDEFKQRLESAEVQEIISKLGKDFRGQKVIVGVDRLDYIKGIPQKLKAFDRFLTENPDWVGKVVLIQLAIPTRTDVDTYQRLREEVERLIGHINGKHGTYCPFLLGLPRGLSRNRDILTFSNPLPLPIYQARDFMCSVRCLRCLHHFFRSRRLEHGQL